MNRLESLYYTAGIVVALGVAFNIGKGIGEDTRESEINAKTEMLEHYKSLENLDLQSKLSSLVSVSDQLARQTAVYDELLQAREKIEELNFQLKDKGEEILNQGRQISRLEKRNSEIENLLDESNATIKNLTFDEIEIEVPEKGAKTLLNGELAIGVESMYNSRLYALINGERHEFKGGTQQVVSSAGSKYRITLVGRKDEENSAFFNIRRFEE